MSIEDVGVERIFQLFFDTKKMLHRCKDTGTWAWSDRDDEHNLGGWHIGFKTAMSAMVDAVEPYLPEE